MALAKFSKFKKERAAIKEARNKEVKTKNSINCLVKLLRN